MASEQNPRRMTMSEGNFEPQQLAPEIQALSLQERGSKARDLMRNAIQQGAWKVPSFFRQNYNASHEFDIFQHRRDSLNLRGELAFKDVEWHIEYDLRRKGRHVDSESLLIEHPRSFELLYIEHSDLLRDVLTASIAYRNLGTKLSDDKALKVAPIIVEQLKKDVAKYHETLPKEELEKQVVRLHQSFEAIPPRTPESKTIRELGRKWQQSETTVRIPIKGDDPDLALLVKRSVSETGEQFLDIDLTDWIPRAEAFDDTEAEDKADLVLNRDIISFYLPSDPEMALIRKPSNGFEQAHVFAEYERDGETALRAEDSLAAVDMAKHLLHILRMHLPNPAT